MDTVGGLIRLGRAYRGLSQRQLAQDAGLPMIRVWRLENGWKPRAAELAQIAKVLQLPELRSVIPPGDPTA